MSVEQLSLVVVVVGIVGSAIEKIGISIGSPKIQNVGKAIESVTADIPKLITNLLGVFKRTK